MCMSLIILNRVKKLLLNSYYFLLKRKLNTNYSCFLSLSKTHLAILKIEKYILFKESYLKCFFGVFNANLAL